MAEIYSHKYIEPSALTATDMRRHKIRGEKTHTHTPTHIYTHIYTHTHTHIALGPEVWVGWVMIQHQVGWPEH